MGIDVVPSGQACGATVRGLDLHDMAQCGLDDATVREIRSAWLEHKVLAFPDQDLSDDDLEAFTLRFGPFGDDPFFASIEGHPHIAAIRRTANETSSLFAENWHADWSFQEFPPDGTCLYAKTIPPVGGDTLFSNQQAALEAMPADLRSRIEGRVAIHSARGGYAPDGTYGDDDDSDRSMQIRPSADAYATQLHPLVRIHPETGAETLYSVLGYIIGIDGMNDDPDDVDEARTLLTDLYHWQTREEFQYRHVWEPEMLVMWDNRCVLHRATGGYEGHERLLHRTTIGYNADVRTG
ncbi:MAG: TauD/TfdA family dioxygenase [Ilumatobacter sp.]|uniref:TauD/TfdA dioxygenase family protein n=1 Tax=Ilumatobacter sp. TaxID=1967498 RepID=UPI003297075A